VCVCTCINSHLTHTIHHIMTPQHYILYTTLLHYRPGSLLVPFLLPSSVHSSTHTPLAKVCVCLCVYVCTCMLVRVFMHEYMYAHIIIHITHTTHPTPLTTHHACHYSGASRKSSSVGPSRGVAVHKQSVQGYQQPASALRCVCVRKKGVCVCMHS
jgi:hypothetical protein